MSHRLVRGAAIVAVAAMGLALVPAVPSLAVVGDPVPVEQADTTTVVALPGAPATVVANAGPGQATVTWTAPAGSDPAAILGYAVEYSEDDGVTWQATSATIASPVAAGSLAVTGLKNGAAYVFRVAALSTAGTGAWSEPTKPVTPLAAPAAPTVVSGFPGSANITVSWVSPAQDNGSAITGYALDYSTDGGATWLASGPIPLVGLDTAYKVTGLVNDTGYRFRVAARNAIGQGPWSYPSGVVTPSDSIPVTAPTGFRVVRTAGAPADLTASWKPVPGATHYTLSVFDGATETARVVDTGSTSVQVPGSGPCVSYKALVAAVDKDGVQARTGIVQLPSAAPGGVRALAGTRTLDGLTGKLTWEAPINPGYTPITGFAVTVTRMSDGVKVVDTVTTSPELTIPDMDPARQYAAKVTAVNESGSCITGTHLFNNTTPGSPVSLAVSRDPSVPTQVNLAWQSPLDSGTSPVIGYEVGYGTARVDTWVAVTGTSLGLTLDPNLDYVFVVRAVNASGNGLLTKAVKLVRVNAPLTPAVDPVITLTEADGTVTVRTDQPVGSNVAYPKLVVAVRPADSVSTFADTHDAFNGATTVVFTQVPCGVYTVTVTGTGGADGDREFARRVVNRCNVGLITQDQWKLVYGKAAIKGNMVDMNVGGESRVMSVTKRTSQDAVFTTTATLKSGWGYGIWLRASLATGAAVTGYSFQYDPGYANVNAGFGKALLLRLWTNGKECGNPIAKVKWPAGLDVNAPHRVTAVAKGDQLYATIDNVNLFTVPSLTAAVAASGCGMPAPTGTEVGFRAWNAGTLATFENTTLS